MMNVRVCTELESGCLDKAFNPITTVKANKSMRQDTKNASRVIVGYLLIEYEDFHQIP